MSILLNVLYFVALTIVSPLILWKNWKHGRYRRGWSERLLGAGQTPPEAHSLVWFHAVSVGEVQVLRTVIETLASKRPDLGIAISVSTDSGMDLARKLFPKYHLFFTPFDFSWAIRRVLFRLRPKLIVLAELELWPNWLLQAERSGCPVAIINGRLSEKSFRGYSRIPFLVGQCLRTIDWVGAQSESIASRFEKLGVPTDRLTVTGNVKFDGATGDRLATEVRLRKAQLGLTAEHTVLLAGSTQSPEEALVLKSFLDLADRFPNLKLILVPRHVERFAEVAKAIEVSGLPWARRTESQTVATDPNWRVFLGDSVGELRWWWGLADIGFVGGSFGDRGGQNMIEPCAYGVATCFGPNTRNFSDIVQLLQEANACEQLQNPDDLRPWIESMLVDSKKREAMANQAIQVCQKHRGASQRSWEKLQRFLPANPND